MSEEAEAKSRRRDELIQRAKLGEITPWDAEAEARLIGCEPLTVRLRSLDLDPRREDAWTLPMALVWIIERDPIAVRAVWTTARRAATYWVGPPPTESVGTGAWEKENWELKPFDPPTVGDVHAVLDRDYEFEDPPTVVSERAARKEHWASLRSGRLPAQGMRCETGERQTIPMSAWTDLDWLADRAAPADTVGYRDEDAPKYEAVGVSWKKVREMRRPLEEVESKEYLHEDWSIEHVVLWIAYQNSTLFHFLGWSGPRAKERFSIAEPRDREPRETLLKALKEGELLAIRNGKELPPEYWFGRDLPTRQREVKGISFRRSDVLDNWSVLPEDLETRVGVLLEQFRRDCVSVRARKMRATMSKIEVTVRE